MRQIFESWNLRWGELDSKIIFPNLLSPINSPILPEFRIQPSTPTQNTHEWMFLMPNQGSVHEKWKFSIFIYCMLTPKFSPQKASVILLFARLFKKFTFKKLTIGLDLLQRFLTNACFCVEIFKKLDLKRNFLFVIIPNIGAAKKQKKLPVIVQYFPRKDAIWNFFSKKKESYKIKVKKCS